MVQQESAEDWWRKIKWLFWKAYSQALFLYTYIHTTKQSGFFNKKVPESSAAGSWLLVTTHKLKFLPVRGAEVKYCFCAGTLAGVGGEEELGIFSHLWVIQMYS